MKIYLLGAHGGYRSQKKPLGGGATIFESLVESWKGRTDLNCVPLGLGPDYPGLSLKELEGRHPAALNYFEYARLCRSFERVSTDYLLQQPKEANAWVVMNDLSEGPDISRLRAHGFRTMTLVHVDVVQFVNTLYLKNQFHLATLTSGWRVLREVGLTRFVPDIIHLIFEKQERAYLNSDAVVVPSAPMKAIILQCYPEIDPAKIHVVPWGDPSSLFCGEDPTQERILAWREKEGVGDDDFLILTLSRISPEKGIDRLIRGLIALEVTQGESARRIKVRIAGDAAYMDGPKTKRELERLIASLRWIEVKFIGYLTGLEKRTAFQAADLYAFCSYHESYGLTLAEAKSEGCRCLVSREVAAIGELSGQILAVEANEPQAVASGILSSMKDSRFDQRTPMRETFDKAAERLVEIMRK